MEISAFPSTPRTSASYGAERVARVECERCYGAGGLLDERTADDRARLILDEPELRDHSLELARMFWIGGQEALSSYIASSWLVPE
jgi:hypothetical protein